MNTILQKRIEEAAHQYIQSDSVAPENMKLAFGDFINGARWALQNQWVSVDDELPKKDEDGSDTSIYVLVTDSTKPFGYIWKAYYDYTIKDWYDIMTCENLSRFNITHWMQIPSLEGGEK